MEKVIKYKPFGDYKPGEDYTTEREYVCQKEWSDESIIHCGSTGVVLKGKDSYRTAFFELSHHDNFIRGEGDTIEDAEISAWEKIEKMITCSEHDFVSKKNNSRDVVCKCCTYEIKNYFPPENTCSVCGKPHVLSKIDDVFYCLKHFSEEVGRKNLTINENVMARIKHEAFEEITDLRNNPEKQNLIFYCADVKNCSSPADLPNDNIYVEIRVKKIKEMEENKYIAEYILRSGLLDKSNEYEIIDAIEKMRGGVYEIAVKKSIKLIKNTILKMYNEGVLTDQFNEFLYMQNNDEVLDELIEEYKLISVKYIIEKELGLSAPELHETVFNKTFEVVCKEMEGKIMLDLLKFIQEK